MIDRTSLIRGDAVHRVLDRDRDELLDFFRPQGRGVGQGDDLHVADVRHRVDRQIQKRINTRRRQPDQRQEDERAILQREVNQPVEHGEAPGRVDRSHPGRRGRASGKRLHEVPKNRRPARTGRRRREKVGGRSGGGSGHSLLTIRRDSALTRLKPPSMTTFSPGARPLRISALASSPGVTSDGAALELFRGRSERRRTCRHLPSTAPSERRAATCGRTCC